MLKPATTDIEALTEEDLLGFVLAELEPFVAPDRTE